ncbi:hypothetical protein FQR65_LT02807 [Abscondita terminalis]|nr:hypothetical protein FQR65_LT02807 [Abscondita terminalis]
MYVGAMPYVLIVSSSSTSLAKFLDWYPNEDKIRHGFAYDDDRDLRYIGENNVACEVIVTKEVFKEEGYEFYPSEYVNKTCANTNHDPYKSGKIEKPEICFHSDNTFGCQTLYGELYVLKKSNIGNKDCWEHTTQPVAIGCKCNIRFTYDENTKY